MFKDVFNSFSAAVFHKQKKHNEAPTKPLPTSSCHLPLSYIKGSFPKNPQVESKNMTANI